ncbi:hypothetical protein BGX31_003514 [Mortierella sp. GBA43]|nr:hypothetical protein BGX31_003514 [Mortierella sp. GBA43]
MDHHNDTSKGNPSGPTSARQMNVYSGEWMTLPTLTAPMSDGGAAISNEDVVQEVHAIDIGIDDIARNKRLETMRSTIATTRRPERATPADAAAAIATEDAKLFLGLYEACFPTTDDRTTEHDGQHPMSQLKREMMIQILEDLGDQLLDTQAVDPTE